MPAIVYNLITTAAVSISFAPTFTNNTNVLPLYKYVLTNFKNTLELKITGLWYNADVK